MELDERPRTAVFDLDGTLTDTRHRNHLIESRPKKWNEFFAGSGVDEPYSRGFDLLTRAVAGGHEVVYLSGRPERIRELSQEWLRRHSCPPGPLVLRSDRDRSTSMEFKLRALRTLAQTRHLALLVDDDPEVVEGVLAEGDLVDVVILADWQPRTVSTPFEAR